MSTMPTQPRSAPATSNRGSEEPTPIGFLAAVVEVTRRDLRREWRSRETVPSMVLFALLVLFIFSLGAQPDFGGEVTGRFGPAVLWVTLFFAASIGVHQMFAAESRDGAFTGLLAAPIDRTAIYLGKIGSCYAFSGAMTGVALAMFYLFYEPPIAGLPFLLVLVACVLFDYIAVGALLSAMTFSLRGGEVLLRLLLFPLMIPVFILAVQATEPLMRTGALPPDPVVPVGGLVGLGALYLAAGTMLFEKVVEE